MYGSGATVARTVRHTRDFGYETNPSLAPLARHTASPIEHHPPCSHPLPTPANMLFSPPKNRGIPSLNGTTRGDPRSIPSRSDSGSKQLGYSFLRNHPFLKRLAPSAFLPRLPQPSDSLDLHRIDTKTVPSKPRTVRCPTYSPVIGPSSSIFLKNPFWTLAC